MSRSFLSNISAPGISTVGTTGSINTNNLGIGAPAPTTGGINIGNGKVNLYNSTAVAPLNFPSTGSTSNPTTTVAGDIWSTGTSVQELNMHTGSTTKKIAFADGTNLSSVPTSAVTGLDTALAGKASATLYYQLGTTTATPFASGTAVFSPLSLGTTSGTGLDVSANTTYAVEMFFAMSGSIATTTNRTLTFSLANSNATISSANLHIVTYANTTQITPTPGAATVYMGEYNVTSAPYTFAVEPQRSGTGTNYRIISIKGFIRIGSVSGGAKLSPLLQFVTNGESSTTCYAGSYASLTPMVGTTSNGTWT